MRKQGCKVLPAFPRNGFVLPGGVCVATNWIIWGLMTLLGNTDLIEDIAVKLGTSW